VSLYCPGGVHPGCWEIARRGFLVCLLSSPVSAKVGGHLSDPRPLLRGDDNLSFYLRKLTHKLVTGTVYGGSLVSRRECCRVRRVSGVRPSYDE